jgi:hypothetical protein
MSTYSFQDVAAAITGPGMNISIGAGQGNAEGGFTVTYTEDKNTMTIGADGEGMHSLHAGKSGQITVRFLKVAPVCSALSIAYAAQTSSASLHGQNLIIINDLARGDVITGRGAAFRKFPQNEYAKDGNVLEWIFDCIKIDSLLGVGVPDKSDQ